MMLNTTGKRCEIVEPVIVKKIVSSDAEEEPEPPEPFQYIED